MRLPEVPTPIPSWDVTAAMILTGKWAGSAESLTNQTLRRFQALGHMVTQTPRMTLSWVTIDSLAVLGTTVARVQTPTSAILLPSLRRQPLALPQVVSA